jgi:hypothetical protein
MRNEIHIIIGTTYVIFHNYCFSTNHSFEYSNRLSIIGLDVVCSVALLSAFVALPVIFILWFSASVPVYDISTATRLVSTGADVIVVFCSLLCDADVFIKLLFSNLLLLKTNNRWQLLQLNNCCKITGC